MATCWKSNILDSMRLPLIVILLTPLLAYGRLGETESQCNTRYGGPKTDRMTLASEKNSPILPGARCRTYDYEGWTIKAAFLEFNGPAVRLVFSKAKGGYRIEDFEAEAILKANTPEGQSWSQVIYSNPDSVVKGAAKVLGNAMESFLGAGAWKRSDGTLAWMNMMRMTLTLDSPEAIEREKQFKQGKEEGKRANVPGF